jgi:hypothetical protein
MVVMNPSCTQKRKKKEKKKNTLSLFTPSKFHKRQHKMRRGTTGKEHRWMGLDSTMDPNL